MNQMQRLKQLGSDLNILYVEDDPDAREILSSLLRRFFGYVSDKENGLLGLHEFENGSYDIVITDIQMPKMNGIDMLGEIKKLDSDVVTGITTAYNDEDFFLKSIDIGVNKYILKPIDTQRVLDALEYLASIVVDRKKAKAYTQQQVQQKINDASQSVVASITKSTPNPTIIYDETKVVFVNDAFSRYLDTQKEYSSIEDIQTLFLPKQGCLQSLKEYDKIHEERNKIALKYERYTKYFGLIQTDFELSDKTYFMITFNDITMLEYSKIKLENYNKTFREYIFHYAKKQNKNKSIKTKHNSAQATKPQPQKASTSTYDASLNEDDKNLLRRSHTHKTTAVQYLQELDHEDLLQLQELDEVIDELSEILTQIKLGETSYSAGLEEFANKLTLFVRAIATLFEFNDLIKALNELAYQVQMLAAQEDENLQKNGSMFLEAIVYDLSSWIRSIFIDQDSLDIHYLDSSLFSSCLQLEMILNQDDSDEDDDDDIDFF
ncbi:MAG: response regulator transcription factor [Campylobacterota bacterium]